MDMDVPSLFDQLVTRVSAAAGSDDPLARLDAALAVAADTAGAGDRLLDHFVAQARHAGLSWTDVGGGDLRAGRRRPPGGDHQPGLAQPGGAHRASAVRARA